jgi:hypothetical protein
LAESIIEGRVATKGIDHFGYQHELSKRGMSEFMSEQTMQESRLNRPLRVVQD